MRNGTVQHEVMEGETVSSFQDGDALLIPIECMEDAGKLDEEIHYGLAVTLEVSQAFNIPLYEEIRSRIRIAIRDR